MDHRADAEPRSEFRAKSATQAETRAAVSSNIQRRQSAIQVVKEIQDLDIMQYMHFGQIRFDRELRAGCIADDFSSAEILRTLSLRHLYFLHALTQGFKFIRSVFVWIAPLFLLYESSLQDRRLA